METLLLTRREVAQLADSRDYLAAMERAFGNLAGGLYELPAVAHIGCRDGALHIKSALGGAAQRLVAIKINANFPDNAHRFGLPTIQGFIALFDAEHGSVLALMDSIEITARRTAAATALAARYLAKQDSTVLGIVGCGAQARYHVDALLDVAPLRSVQFCEPRAEAAAAFERHVRDRGLDCARMSSSSEAARGADIIVTLTTSTQPLLSVADVDAGGFVAGVGADNPSKHELAPDLLKRSRLVVDSLAQASTMGDLHHALRLEAMTATDVHAELADIVAGRVPARTSAVERIVFDSTGLAIQDLAAAEMIHARARQHAVGLPISLGSN